MNKISKKNWLRLPDKGSITFLLTAFALLWVAGNARLYAQSGVSEEYTLKAIFIYNFATYIEWPDTIDTSNLKILILGDSEIRGHLDQIAETYSSPEKEITVSSAQDTSEIGNCNILFIPSSWKDDLEEILAIARDNNILAISESDGLAELGTAINFVTRDQKIKFEINSEALEESGLKASSQLIKLAILVN